MFINLNFYFLFLCLIYNVINFDEEFLVMCTIIISFSQIINILFENILENYKIFTNSLKNLYKFLVKLYINYIQNIFSAIIYMEEYILLLYALYSKLQIQILKLNIFFHINKLYILQLLNIILMNNLLKYNYLIEHYTIWYRLMYNIRSLWIKKVCSLEKI